MSSGNLRIREYQVSHRTHYRYSFPASLCHNQLHLRPREVTGQTLLHASIQIDPAPAYRSSGLDSFGNPTEFFSIEHAHDELCVHSSFSLQRLEPNHPSQAGFTADELLDWLNRSDCAESIQAQEFLSESRYCSIGNEFIQFLKPVWEPQQDALRVIDQVNQFIHESIQYQPLSTDVTTPSILALRNRRGVCQDLANVFISCMRSLGIPARYVSGYLVTTPPPGQPKLVGSDASHAWTSLYLGSLGWIDWDPTNNKRVDLDHITLAWGRDYADVAPIQGVFVGGGGTSLEVAVDVVLANESA